MSNKEYKTLEASISKDNEWYSNQKHGEIYRITNTYCMFVCPVCGYHMGLEHGLERHEGKVTLTPSVGCPNPTCYAHMLVKEGKIEVLSLWKSREEDDSDVYKWC